MIAQQVVTDTLVWAILLHFVADWLLQTDWMAMNKTSLRHPAAYVHAGIYGAVMLLIFSAPVALVIGITHLLVDTRHPVRWYRRHIKGMSDLVPGANGVDMVIDQIVHILTLALVVLVS